MSITVVRFQKSSTRRAAEAAGWGLVQGRTVRAIPGNYATLAEFLARGAPRARSMARAKGGSALPIEKIQLLSPVTPDGQIVCQGKNYVDHIKETGFRPGDKTYNLFFTKASSSLAPGRGIVYRPPGVRLLDYEIELGLVLGKAVGAGAKLPINPADCVAGLVVANDISARDIQVPQGQWFKGKSFRGFCPVGPYLVLLDRAEFARLGDLELTLRVNGEMRQHAFVRQMIYPPAETLGELAGVMDLKPGDLILTGTPSGVSMQVPGGWLRKLATLLLSEKQLMRKFVELQDASGRYLKNGDVIHATIAGAGLDLGMQELTVQALRS